MGLMAIAENLVPAASQRNPFNVEKAEGEFIRRDIGRMSMKIAYCGAFFWIRVPTCQELRRVNQIVFTQPRQFVSVLRFRIAFHTPDYSGA